MKEDGEAQPLFAKIRAEGVRRELPLLQATVLELARGNLRIRNGRVYSRGRLLPGGWCANKALDIK